MESFWRVDTHPALGHGQLSGRHIQWETNFQDVIALERSKQKRGSEGQHSQNPCRFLELEKSIIPFLGAFQARRGRGHESTERIIKVS